MAKSGHTEGAWDKDGNTVSKFGRGVIATCPMPQNGGVFECVANARLIAAAPELLDALRETQEILRILVQPDMTVASHQVYYRAHAASLAARKAIAKATDAPVENKQPADID